MPEGEADVAGRRLRHALARHEGLFSAVWFTSVLTTLAFVGLYRVHLVGNLPLWTLLGLLVMSGLASELGGRWLARNPTDRHLQGLVAVHILAVAVIIYAIGWGPTLAVGYLFVVAKDLEDFGSRVTRPALFWTVAATALGQGAIAIGVVPTYVHQPAVHGVAVLECLGIAFVVYLLGSKTAERERDQSALAAGRPISASCLLTTRRPCGCSTRRPWPSSR